MLLNAAILRQPALRDVHISHHFHARDNRQSQMARRRRHFVKRAIYPIANFEFVFEWLKVNVARPIQDRLIKDQIDKADNGRCIRLGFNGCLLVSTYLQKLANFTQLFEDLLHGGGLTPVILLDELFDLLGWRNDNLNVFA